MGMSHTRRRSLSIRSDLTLEGQIDAASLEGNEAEVRRLTPLVKRAKIRWIKANRRVTRGN